MASNRIEDVAARAGVSMKTVSRVLNNEPNVRQVMRDKVMQAVAELNYRPNLSARGLAGKRSYLIGLLYGNISSAYLVNVQTGVLEVCNGAHYGLVLHPCSGAPENLVDEIESFAKQSRIDGLVLTPPVADCRPLIDMLAARNIHHVRISPLDATGGAAVTIDEYQASYDVTQYLVDLGHRRIGFIKGATGHAASYLRFSAFWECLRANGVAPDESLVVQGDFSYESGVSAGRGLLDLAHAPSAIFASNDDMAAGVMHVAHDRGIKVPDQLSVTGFDDSPLSWQIWPRLTTVHQPIRQLGQAAASRLLRMIRGRENADDSVGSEILGYALKIRDSTGPAR